MSNAVYIEQGTSIHPADNPELARAIDEQLDYPVGDRDEIYETSICCEPKQTSEYIIMKTDRWTLGINIEIGDLIPSEDEARLALVAVPDEEIEGEFTYELLYTRNRPSDSTTTVTIEEWKHIATLVSTSEGLEITPKVTTSEGYSTYLLPHDRKGTFSIVSTPDGITIEQSGLRQLQMGESQ